MVEEEKTVNFAPINFTKIFWWNIISDTSFLAYSNILQVSCYNTKYERKSFDIHQKSQDGL
jgi:hypothetical protein